ncbi:glycosyltransferase [Marinobacter sp. 1Y8]
MKIQASGKFQTGVTALLVAGLAGACLHPALPLVAAALLTAIGLGVIQGKHLVETGWEVPRELRLMHFGFWFFATVVIVAWIASGFSSTSWTLLAGAVLTAFFWPLAVTFSYVSIGATSVFTAFTCASVIATTAIMADLTVTPGQAGLAAVFATGTLIAAPLFWSTTRKALAITCLLIGSAGIAAALMALTQNGTDDTITAHSGLIAGSAWRWLAVAFLLGIPAWLFWQFCRADHAPIRYLAYAGLIIPVSVIVIEATSAANSMSALLAFYVLALAAIASALFTELRSSYTRTRAVKVSATVITMNEADNIAACLQSARKVADEIIVIDSGSTDGTAEIAKQYADIVEVTDWPGFGIQKQRALDKATGDWVLSIDADERVSPELAREINHHLAQPDADAYKLPWAVTIYGTQLDFGRSGRAPLRLFRREGVSFSDALVHERILIPEGRRTRTLRGRLTHFTHRDFGHSLEKSAKYAWLGALEKHRRGKKTRTLLYPTLRGLLTFVHVYLLRFGFLDGQVGYLTAVTYAQVTFNKYAGLWALDRPSASKIAD